MSKYLSKKRSALKPYTPGEQPRDRRYIKLNTNESPFPPSPKAIELGYEAMKNEQLYSDPTCKALITAASGVFGVGEDCILFTNGSDDALNFAFMAFCDENHGAAFADITYGFYPVFANLNHVPYTLIPLKDDFSIDIRDYFGIGKTIFIANPNAPTGLALTAGQIEEIVRANPGNVVVVDEAYTYFGSESCIPLTKKYENLLVIGTFSKSRSMAGARLGYAIGCPSLISDLNLIKYSTNPYCINSVTLAMGVGALSDEEYTKNNCRIVSENREYTYGELIGMGFFALPSKSNFIFAKHPTLSGEEVYKYLRERGILVRYLKGERTSAFVRISVGTRAEMEKLVQCLKEI